MIRNQSLIVHVSREGCAGRTRGQADVDCARGWSRRVRCRQLWAPPLPWLDPSSLPRGAWLGQALRERAGPRQPAAKWARRGEGHKSPRSEWEGSIWARFRVAARNRFSRIDLVWLAIGRTPKCTQLVSAAAEKFDIDPPKSSLALAFSLGGVWAAWDNF